MDTNDIKQDVIRKEDEAETKVVLRVFLSLLLWHISTILCISVPAQSVTGSEKVMDKMISDSLPNILIHGQESNLQPKLKSISDKIARFTKRRQTGWSVPSPLIHVRNQTPVTEALVVRSCCLVHKCWRKSNLCSIKKLLSDRPACRRPDVSLMKTRNNCRWANSVVAH